MDNYRKAPGLLILPWLRFSACQGKVVLNLLWSQTSVFFALISFLVRNLFNGVKSSHGV